MNIETVLGRSTAEISRPIKTLVLPDGQETQSFKGITSTYSYLLLFITAYEKNEGVLYEELVESVGIESESPRHLVEVRLSACRNVLKKLEYPWTIVRKTEKGEDGKERNFVYLTKPVETTPMKGHAQESQETSENPTELPKNSKVQYPPVVVLPDNASSISTSENNTFILNILNEAYKKDTLIDHAELTRRLQEKDSTRTNRDIDLIIASCRNILARKGLGWTVEIMKTKGEDSKDHTYVSLKKREKPISANGNNENPEGSSEDTGNIEQKHPPGNNGRKFPPPDTGSIALVANSRLPSNLSPEERIERRKTELQRARAQIAIALTRELILPSQAEKPGKKIDLLELLGKMNPNQNITVEEIVRTNIDEAEYLLQAAEHFALAAVGKTIQGWWDIERIEDIGKLEPIERMPAKKVLELKAQGSNIQAVLNQIFNKFLPTFSPARKSPEG